MCAQGAVWYFTFFYMQVFLGRSLGVPAATKNMLLIVMTLVSAPLYVFFGWLSDRVGRKPVMVGGMLLALALYFPGFHWIAQAANPALAGPQQSTPVVVETDPRPARSSSTRSAPPSSPAPATSPRACWSPAASPTRHARRRRPDARYSSATGSVPIASGDALTAADLKALKARDRRAIGARSAPPAIRQRRPERDEPAVLIAILLLFVVAATALYGPQAAALVEMFPTRVRYTAMSLPYHVGTGWVGGFLPVTSFAMVAITGDIYASLWYPVFFTAFRWSCRCSSSRKPAASRWRRSRLRRPVDVDRLLGLGQHPADRQLRALPVGDRLRAARGSAPGMVMSTVRADRIAARVSVTRGPPPLRIGHHADRAPRLGRIERILQVGPAKIEAALPSSPMPKPDQVRRPRQVLQPRVGGIAGHL